MRAMFGQGTPREAASARHALLLVVQTDSTLAIAVMSAIDGENGNARHHHRARDPLIKKRHSSPGCQAALG